MSALRDNLLAACEVAPSGCWLWRRSISPKGYGRVNVDGKNRQAHRVSFERVHGPIPDGLVVCHRCDVRACINPDHLFLGTIADNNLDRDLKHRRHMKLTPDEAQRIRLLARSGAHYAALAAQYGISYDAVYQLVVRRTWKRLPELGAL